MTPIANEPARPLPDNSLAKKQTLLLILALAFVAGWFQFIIGEKSNYLPLFKLFYSIVNLIFVVRWVALDAIGRQFKLSQGWIIFCVLITPLAMLFYFFKTRGKAAWRSVLLSVCFLFLMGTCFSLGSGAADLLKLGHRETTAQTPAIPDSPATQ